jgi:EAL domain-containing protein (putative c-di-GMP-specific phosphodiesterase class I)
MRDGDPASPGLGGAEGVVARSYALAAEEMVRAGGGSSFQWDGARITTHFQPIYSVRTRMCLGFEALARASDRSGYEMAADDFFAGVSETSRGLLDWTCRALHLRNYATVDPGDRMLFINVHPEAAARDARRALEFGDLIRYYGLHPKRVCIEILECDCSDEAALRDAVMAYRSLGTCVALDDFGVGCSDFGRVKSLRPDVVKVDRSVIGTWGATEVGRKALRQMVTDLRACGAKVAIEGVETREEALLAVDVQADYLQGRYFAVPNEGLGGEMVGTQALDQLLNPRPSRRAAA